ncbi:sarcosine oxidase subunit gamma [Pararhodobacter sp.]|uniref:sarcosine oxidase subunit gamma n=1 Tax=Pararhodobacter sp. TaxID=2127056 RepID=UPI002AFEE030|nr:sarcosine oxidase subunit gamma family protein [Pararhodobacter sp.]
MADIVLHATPATGADLSIGPNRITERSDLALVSIAIPLGGDEQLAKALKTGWSLDMPNARRSRAAPGVRAIRTAQDQLFLVFPHATPDARRSVEGTLNGVGYTTDQSDNWVLLEVVGPDTRAALERICLLDLHPDVFAIGDSARTVMDHIGAMILRSGPDTYLLMAARTFAGSFLGAIETSFENVI